MIINFHAGLGDELAVTAIIREYKRQHPEEIIHLEEFHFPEIFEHNPYLRLGSKNNGIKMGLKIHVEEEYGNIPHCFGKQIGISVNNTSPEMYLTSEELLIGKSLIPVPRRPTIAIDPWAMWPSRRWNFKKFMALTSRLKALGWSTIQIGKNVPDAKGNTYHYPLGAHADLHDRLTVRETAAVLYYCDVFVGNDTGGMHLAAAVSTPQVAFYSIKRWYSRAYWNTIPLFDVHPCDKRCGETCVRKSPSFCLDRISQERVIDAINVAQWRYELWSKQKWDI